MVRISDCNEDKMFQFIVKVNKRNPSKKCADMVLSQFKLDFQSKFDKYSYPLLNLFNSLYL
jgi:hypothetical protein